MQKNFFITPDEFPQIADFFKIHDCLLIKNNVPTEMINTDISFENCLSQLFLTKDTFLENIHFNKQDKKGYYYIDVIKSYAVEFDLGGFFKSNSNDLHRGRFFCITSFYKNNVLIKKDDEFIKWVKKIFKLFEKIFLVKSIEYKPYYFSENALKWIEKNNAYLTDGGLKFSASTYC